MKLLGLVLVIACVLVAAIVSADERKADSPACPVPVSPEQSVVIAKAGAEYKATCAQLVKGAFDAFVREQAVHQANVERAYRAHQSAVKPPATKPAEPPTETPAP